MLREVVTADRPMTWDNAHEMVEFDPRCRAVASTAQREDWFREFSANVRPVKTRRADFITVFSDISNKTQKTFVRLLATLRTFV